jgi:hypothetical protein
MQEFAFTVPALIDEANRILSGHGRLEAAKLLGLADMTGADAGNPCKATSWSNRACSIWASLGPLVGRLSCLRSQKRTDRSPTPNAATSVRRVMPAETREARS